MFTLHHMRYVNRVSDAVSKKSRNSQFCVSWFTWDWNYVKQLWFKKYNRDFLSLLQSLQSIANKTKLLVFIHYRMIISAYGKAKQILIVPTSWKLQRCFRLPSGSSSVASNYWGNFQYEDVPHTPPAKLNLSWSLGITCCHLSTLLACNDKFACSHLCFPKCGRRCLQNSSRSRYVSPSNGKGCKRPFEDMH